MTDENTAAEENGTSAGDMEQPDRPRSDRGRLHASAVVSDAAGEVEVAVPRMIRGPG